MKISRNRFLAVYLSAIAAMVSLAPAFLAAQDISGTWHGKLSLPVGRLNIVFHIERDSAGNYVSTLDSPDQSATGIKTESTVFADSVVEINIPAVRGKYKGKFCKNGKMSGHFVQGVSLQLDLERGEYVGEKRPQEPKPPYPYVTEEVSVKNDNDGIMLAGTLSLPRGAGVFPAVVMVTGSGANNRDEEIMGHKPFLVIADHLTRNGIAVLRCDDRGTAASEGDFSAATNCDFVSDTEAMIRYLRGRKEIDGEKIGIIGHSCGGTVAFRVAAANPSVAFVASMAGAAVKGDSLMLKQVEMISRQQGLTNEAWARMKPLLRKRYALLCQADKTPAEIRGELEADIKAQLPPSVPVDKATASRLESEVATMTSPWYLEFMRYDPAEALSGVKCPVLALNGDRDLQVDPCTNLGAIKSVVEGNGNRHVTVKSYPGLNHLFQTCKDGSIREYAEIEETISPVVLADITEWIISNLF